VDTITASSAPTFHEKNTLFSGSLDQDLGISRVDSHGFLAQDMFPSLDSIQRIPEMQCVRRRNIHNINLWIIVDLLV
jgi:hypothetical protein